MTDKKQIKSDAKQAFDNDNHSLAFQTLWGLDNVGEFISYAIKKVGEKEKVKKGKKEDWFLSEYFWTDFILQQEHFSGLLSSDSAIQLLHHYFNTYKKTVDNFERKVAQEFPEIFVKAIRLNQTFLKSERIESLQSIELDEQFRIHQKFWGELHNIELNQWEIIKSTFQEVKKYSLEEILSYYIIWFDTKNSSINSLQVDYHLSRIYSFFIELVFSETLITEQINQVNLNQVSERLKKINVEKQHEIFHLLETINKWVDLCENIINPYCFDLNFEPAQENECVFLQETPESYFKWKINGIRYEMNKLMYYDLHQGDKVKATHSILEDLQFNANRYNKIEYSTVEDLFRFSSTLNPLNTFSLINKDEIEKIMNRKSIDFLNYTPKVKTFNRFDIQYNAWHRPLIGFGEMFLCPTLFNYNWFYTLAEITLNEKNDNLVTNKIENFLGDKFKENDWKVKVTNAKDENILRANNGGDVDIIIEEKDTTLLIQLKRTYLRLNPKDAYNESVSNDEKASKQLNEVEKFLSKPNDIHLIKCNPIKWIVTTSYEHIGEFTDNCRKVNYFDILHILRNFQGNNLKDFIDFVENDQLLKHWKDCLQNELTIFESKKYKKPIFSDDEQLTNKYNNLFDKALELHKVNKKEQALKLLEECISINSSDATTYAVIANILADLKKYDESFDSFEKALALLPNDPFVTRNYAIALKESGNRYESLKLLKELKQRYPLLADFESLFNNDRDKSIEKGGLTESQIIELFS